MMYTTGIVYSLKGVAEKFIEFAQQSNSNTQAWELLDNRLSSFYGATLKIPLMDWQTESLEVPCFYLSLEHMDVVDDKQGNSTYASWLRTGIRMKEYVAKKHKDEYMGDYTDLYYQSEKYNHATRINDGSRTATTKYGKNNRENIFKNTGEFVAVGLHTLYDERLWMCEQGQITCKKEATEQLNDLHLLPAVTYTAMGGQDKPALSLEELPVFPGTGCPWFTISDDNKEEYNVEENGIKYWFTKSNYDATITIMVQNQGATPDCYQSMSFGRLGTTDKLSHVYPLYVAGGNQGLSQDTMVYTPPGDNQKPTNTGPRCVYDLDIGNISLANSNLLTPTKFNGANMSNFRVLSAEGTWRDIFAFSQDSKVSPLWSCSMCTGDGPSDFVALLKEPEVLKDEHHSAYHCMAESWNRIDIYTVNKPFNNYDHSSTLERVLVFLNNLYSDGEQKMPEALEREKNYGTGTEVSSGSLCLKCVKSGTTGVNNISFSSTEIGSRINDGDVIWEITEIRAPKYSNGFEGYIPNVYANWFRELPIGEITINNKRYLSVPNGWETRLWFYESSAEPPKKNDLENSKLKKKMDDILKAGGNIKMTHRLIIPLEDGA